jgi:DnaJ like chaperone protein
MSSPNSLWQRLLDLATGAFSARSAEAGPDGAFAAAVVALAAKMAKADGLSSREEAAAFRAAFPVAAQDRGALERLFALAEETVHGFEGYARQLARSHATRPDLLEATLDVLFAVARADGAIPHDYARIAAPHFPDRPPDPYAVLAIDPDASDAQVRQAWRKAVADHHPDRFVARGAPPDFIEAAHARTAALNAAYAAIKKSRPKWQQAD